MQSRCKLAVVRGLRRGSLAEVLQGGCYVIGLGNAKTSVDREALPQLIACLSDIAVGAEGTSQGFTGTSLLIQVTDLVSQP